LQTAEVFRQRYGIPITQAYGIIEVGLPLVNLDKPVEKPESVGKALPDYEVAVLDDNLCAVADNSMGQLAIKGPGMLDAYLSPPQRRSEVLHEGWFLTGDLARQDDEGFVSIVGRTKAMINVGGNKVFPEEVEAVINEHPSVAASKVSARPHPQLGEAVHADIVCRDRAQGIDAEQIIAFCRRHLTSFKVPSSVAAVDSLRQTASGKISRH
jgi:acyl-CoA synthetase (AMP-forming)/AMP-acid ligase II